jgi:hypothetical protein
MKKALMLALAAAALPLGAAADVRVERTYTDDGRVIERRYYEPGSVAPSDRAYREYYSERYTANPYYVERPYVAGQPVVREYPLSTLPGASAIHTGANNAADQVLADNVGAAFAADSRLDGITATVVANNGQVSLSGSAKSPEQASIAENVARRVAGWGAVSGTLSSTGQ